MIRIIYRIRHGNSDSALICTYRPIALAFWLQWTMHAQSFLVIWSLPNRLSAGVSVMQEKLVVESLATMTLCGTTFNRDMS